MKQSSELLLNFLESITVDGYEAQQTPKQIEEKLGAIIALPDSIAFVYNFRAGKVTNFKGFDTVLGYRNSKIPSPEFFLNCVHPEDRPIVDFLGYQAAKFNFDTEGVTPFSTMSMINFRVRTASGQYIMLMDRSTVFSLYKGKVESTLSILQDMSFVPEMKSVRSKVVGSIQSIKEFETLSSEFSNGHAKLGPFTDRELEILRLLAQGLQSSTIGERLFISTHTVYNHRKNMLRKTSLKNTADLVRYGLQQGLV